MMASQTRKAITVTTSGPQGSVVLALALKALGTKVNGQEAAAVGSGEAEARDLLNAGPFNVTGTIQFMAKGNIGQDTTTRKAYGFEWIKMVSMLLCKAGITRNHMQRMLASMVQARRDEMEFDASADTRRLALVAEVEADPAFAQACEVERGVEVGQRLAAQTVTYHDFKGQLPDGAELTILAADVANFATEIAARVDEIEEDGKHFAQMLMQTRPQRGAVNFSEVEIMALAVEARGNESREVA